MSLPEKVNAIFTLTYNVREVRNSIAELNEIEPSEVKEYEIIDLIQTWIVDDYGTLADKVILQDENGREVDW